ncbi:MAG: hypothetical protein NUW37_17705 [Planctomycetes bacterium]|nr:hypothetical protein [Planctomycetota bacterium]
MPETAHNAEAKESKFKQILKSGAELTTVENLNRRLQSSKVKNVRVLDEKKIMELIEQAVTAVLEEKASGHAEEERIAISLETVDEFSEMLREHEDSIAMQDELEAARAQLDVEYERLAKGIAARLSGSADDTEDIGVEDLKAQFSTLMNLLSDKDSVLYERTRELAKVRRKLAKALDQVSTQHREIATIKAAESGDKQLVDESHQREIEILKKEKESLSSAVEKASMLTDAITKENRSFRNKIKTLEETVAELDRHRREGGAEYSGLKDEIRILETSVVKKNERIGELKSETERLAKEKKILADNIGELGSIIDEKEKKLTLALEAAEEAKNSAEAHSKSANKAKVELAEVHERAQIAEEASEALQKEIVKLEQSITKFANELESERKKYSSLEEEATSTKTELDHMHITMEGIMRAMNSMKKKAKDAEEAVEAAADDD